MSHTPGPWWVGDDRVLGQTLPWRSTGLIWAGEEFALKHIASTNSDRLHSNSPPEQIEEFEANARLIAVAPEMLKAIKDLVMCGPLISQAMFDESIAEFERLIARAEGK